MLAVALLMGWGALSAPASAAPVGFAPTGQLTGLGSGKIWSVAVEPSLPSTILAGTDVGVYVSHNTGATWIRTLARMRVWTVGFDARNPSNVFVGTDGSGVYASADSGATWVAASRGLGNLDVRALAFGLDGIAAGTGAGVALSPNGRVWHDGGLDGSPGTWRGPGSRS
jgi:hypothetical protein